MKHNIYSLDVVTNTPKLSGLIYEISPCRHFDTYQTSKFYLHGHNSYNSKSIDVVEVMDTLTSKYG